MCKVGANWISQSGIARLNILVKDRDVAYTALLLRLAESTTQRATTKEILAAALARGYGSWQAFHEASLKVAKGDEETKWGDGCARPDWRHRDRGDLPTTRGGPPYRKLVERLVDQVKILLRRVTRDPMRRSPAKPWCSPARWKRSRWTRDEAKAMRPPTGGARRSGLGCRRRPTMWWPGPGRRLQAAEVGEARRRCAERGRLWFKAGRREIAIGGQVPGGGLCYIRGVADARARAEFFEMFLRRWGLAMKRRVVNLGIFSGRTSVVEGRLPTTKPVASTAA